MGGEAGHAAGVTLVGDLLERDRELRLLRGCMLDAAGGSGQVLLLEGEAGLGKSRLLQEAEQAGAAEGLTVLKGRCDELQAALPWSLARALLSPALDALTPHRRTQMLAGAGGEAAQLFATAENPGAGASGRGVLARAHALTWLASDLAARAPLAILVDDLHWADEPSMQFLAYLSGRIPSLPIALVAARRPRETSADRGMVERMVGHSGDRVLAIRPLSAAGVGELISQALDQDVEEQLTDACVEATGGNPFYVHELARELDAARDRGRRPDAALVHELTPATVVRSVRTRLDRLGGAAVPLAAATAVLGSGAPLAHAAELAEVDLTAAAGALEALAEAQILHDEEPLAFVHPLVAAAVRADLGVSRRGMLHLRAARILARDRIEIQRVAVHLLAGARRGDGWVVDTLRAASAAALDSGAPGLAADCLSRALEEPPDGVERPELLAELGRVETSLGRSGARQHLRAALELTDTPERRARLLLELGRTQVLAGDHPGAAATFDDGVRGLEDQRSELARELRAARWMSSTLGGSNSSDEIGTEDSELVYLSDPLSGGERQLLAQLVQQRAFEGRPAAELRRLAERAWGDGALLRVEGCDGITWPLVTGALWVAGELELGVEICGSVLADARRSGSPMAYATASYCRSWPLLHRGQVDAAAADALAALAARADGWAAFVGSAVTSLAAATLARGEITEARALLTPAVEDPQIQRSAEYAFVLWADGCLLAAEGRPEDALERLLAVGDTLRPIGADQATVVPWLRDAAIAAAAVGDEARALALVEEGLQDTRRNGIPAVHAGLLRARAHAERGEDAIASLYEAAALLAGGPPRLERMNVLVDLGGALRRVQRRAEARAPLEEALRLAQAGGARLIAARAMNELAAAGVRPDLAGTAGPSEELTPSERRVARLAAAGHSNREIAEMLFVTVKTVEYHLGNTYSKLNIRRRGQLARALGTDDLRPSNGLSEMVV